MSSPHRHLQAMAQAQSLFLRERPFDAVLGCLFAPLLPACSISVVEVVPSEHGEAEWVSLGEWVGGTPVVRRPEERVRVPEAVTGPCLRGERVRLLGREVGEDDVQVVRGFPLMVDGEVLGVAVISGPLGTDEEGSLSWLVSSAASWLDARRADASRRAAHRRLAQAEATARARGDIVLAGALPDVLSDLEQRTDIEHLTFEVRRRKKLIAAEPAFTSGGIAMHRLWLDRSGAAGYVLWPAGARRLLAHSEGRPHLADGVICSCPDLLSYQAVPALALQADRCAVYGIPAPIDTSSSLVRPRGRKARKTGGQLMRRVAAQARSGARFGKMLGGAQRLHVPVDRAMFI